MTQPNTPEANKSQLFKSGEGALWGAIQAHGLLPETVIVSDNAGQFAIGLQGLC